jgi:hypothetical protein
MTSWAWTLDRSALYREMGGRTLFVQAASSGRWFAAVETAAGKYEIIRRIDRRPRTRHGAMCRAHRMGGSKS